MTQTFEMTVCRWCLQDTPKIGSYCMHCGRDPKPLRSMRWPGTKLELSDSVDFHLLMEAVFGERPEKVPSVEAVRWALRRLNEKEIQVIIRLYGLDGRGVRKVQAICQEIDRSDTTIYSTRNKSLKKLRHLSVTQVLLGYAPLPVIG